MKTLLVIYLSNFVLVGAKMTVHLEENQATKKRLFFNAKT